MELFTHTLPEHSTAINKWCIECCYTIHGKKTKRHFETEQLAWNFIYGEMKKLNEESKAKDVRGEVIKKLKI